MADFDKLFAALETEITSTRPTPAPLPPQPTASTNTPTLVSRPNPKRPRSPSSGPPDPLEPPTKRRRVGPSKTVYSSAPKLRGATATASTAPRGLRPSASSEPIVIGTVRTQFDRDLDRVVSQAPSSSAPDEGGSRRRRRRRRKRQGSGALRNAGGEVWEDHTMQTWPENDHRIFVGNLDPSVTESQLLETFRSLYPSTAKARIVLDKRTRRSKYGFVSLMDADEFVKALLEMDGKFIGDRPVQVKKGKWKERDLGERKREGREFQFQNSNKRRSNVRGRQ